MKIFMWASVPGNGLESYSRGECRWTLNVAKTLIKYGHEVSVFPADPYYGMYDAEELKPNYHRIASCPEAQLKEQLKDELFDVALFLVDSKTTGRGNLIRAKKYVYGELNDTNITDRGYGSNEFVARWNRADMDKVRTPELRKKSFLLAQPFGEKLGNSKFHMRRIAWTAKYSLSPKQISGELFNSGEAFFKAMIAAAKETRSSISIFNTEILLGDQLNMYNVCKNNSILDTLKDVVDVKLYPTMSQNSFHEELSKCSIMIPVERLLGGWLGGLIRGLVPVLFKDTWHADHPLVKDYTSQRMGGIKTVMCSENQMKEELVKLLTDINYYNETLGNLQKMTEDNLESSVIKQFEEIMSQP